MDENWDDDNLQDQSQQANKNTQIKDTPQMNLAQNEISTPKTHQAMQNPQPAQTLLNALDKYMEQACHQEEEWKNRMEKLNEKYRLDCFSNSELHSESDEGEDYRYKHNYETHI